jgi:RecG-like helicase
LIDAARKRGRNGPRDAAAILLAYRHGLRAAELHGNLTQRARLEALEAFRTGAADILVATDLAGRGLPIRLSTIEGVDHFNVAGFRAGLESLMPWLREQLSR